MRQPASYRLPGHAKGCLTNQDLRPVPRRAADQYICCGIKDSMSYLFSTPAWCIKKELNIRTVSVIWL
jgi:hypothetical protein